MNVMHSLLDKLKGIQVVSTDNITVELLKLSFDLDAQTKKEYKGFELKGPLTKELLCELAEKVPYEVMISKLKNGKCYLFTGYSDNAGPASRVEFAKKMFGNNIVARLHTHPKSTGDYRYPSRGDLETYDPTLGIHVVITPTRLIQYRYEKLEDFKDGLDITLSRIYRKYFPGEDDFFKAETMNKVMAKFYELYPDFISFDEENILQVL